MAKHLRNLKNDVTVQVEVDGRKRRLGFRSGKESEVELDLGFVAVVVDAFDPMLRRQADADDDDDEDVERDRQEDERLETLRHSGKKNFLNFLADPDQFLLVDEFALKIMIQRQDNNWRGAEKRSKLKLNSKKAE